MKRKTNISVLDNRGIRVTSNMVVGEEFNGYSSGDILDANAIISIIKYFMRSGFPITGSVTSDNIADGTIQAEDLHEDLINSINNIGSAEYGENETLEFNHHNI